MSSDAVVILYSGTSAVFLRMIERRSRSFIAATEIKQAVFD
jgi:hypothetical protein